LYATYFGGSGWEHVDGGISRFDKAGIVYQTSCTDSPNWPTTTGAFGQTIGGSWDMAAFKFDFEAGAFNSDFEISFSGSSNWQGCYPATVTFDNTSLNGQSFYWDFGDGNFDTVMNPTHQYATPGVYSIMLAGTDTNSCVPYDTVYGEIVLSDPDTVIASDDMTICIGSTDSVQLFATTASNYFTWTPSEFLSDSTVQNPMALPDTTTVFYVTVFDTVGCYHTDSVIVFVSPSIEVEVNLDTSICPGDSASLSAIGNGSFEWLPPQFVDDPGAADVKASPDQTTIFSVILRSGTCIPDTAYVEVRVMNLPTANAGPDADLVLGQSLALNGDANGNFIWVDHPSMLDNTTLSPLVNPLETTEYILTSTNLCGEASDTVIITVTDGPANIAVPLAFTPNGDGKNDVFLPRFDGGAEIKHFRIYNRWGEIVFTTEDENEGWDGNYKGSKQPTGTYLYEILGVLEDGVEQPLHGTVSLIR